MDPGNDEEEENGENAEKISIDENPVYNINTDTMHAKLHSEFIKSVSFLIFCVDKTLCMGTLKKVNYAQTLIL